MDEKIAENFVSLLLSIDIDYRDKKGDKGMIAWDEI